MTVVGVGIDVVEIARFARVLQRTPGIVGRIMGPAEQRDLGGRSVDPGTLAGRFAAKEAVMKALGAGLGALGPADVVVRELGGVVRVELEGRAAALAARQRVCGLMVTVSRTESVATAVAIARR